MPTIMWDSYKKQTMIEFFKLYVYHYELWFTYFTEKVGGLYLRYFVKVRVSYCQLFVISRHITEFSLSADDCTSCTIDTIAFLLVVGCKIYTINKFYLFLLETFVTKG